MRRGVQHKGTSEMPLTNSLLEMRLEPYWYSDINFAIKLHMGYLSFRMDKFISCNIDILYIVKLRTAFRSSPTTIVQFPIKDIPTHMSEAVIETYISERSSLIVDRFLFAEKLEDAEAAALDAIKNATAVLVSHQLSNGGEIDIVPATIEKIDSLSLSERVTTRCNLLKSYYAYCLETQRGKITMPSSAPIMLPITLVSHILRLLTFTLSKKSEFNRDTYFSILRDARNFAQKLSRTADAFHRALWLEGLCYIWQAIGSGPEGDISIKKTLLNHVRHAFLISNVINYLRASMN